jgi:hypothetical protein
MIHLKLLQRQERLWAPLSHRENVVSLANTKGPKRGLPQRAAQLKQLNLQWRLIRTKVVAQEFGEES